MAMVATSAEDPLITFRLVDSDRKLKLTTAALPARTRLKGLYIIWIQVYLKMQRGG